MTDWKNKVLEHLNLIDSMAARRFAQAALSEEASLYVMEHLEKDNWRRVRNFSGRSSFRTFLFSTVTRLLEDFSRKKFGRVSIPLWIKKLGGIWPHIFKLLCLERMGVHDTEEMLCLKYPSISKAEIHAASMRILEKVVDCGKSRKEAMSLDDDPSPAVAREHYFSQAPEDEALKKERKLIFEAIFEDLTLGNPVKKNLEDSFCKIMETGIHLEAQEKLLLKLHFQDNLSVSDAGRLLGLNPHQAHGKLRRLLKRLRQDFDKAGIDESLRSLLHEE